MIGNFSNGIEQKFLLSECRDSTGNVIAENGKGKWVKFDEYFKLKLGEGQVDNGVEEGDWKGSINETTRYSCTYVNGKVTAGISREQSGTEHLFDKEAVEAEFIGGQEAFGQYLGHTIRYPGVARENNIQGRVFVSFVVLANGTLNDIKVLRGIGSGCDEETVRVIALSSGNWKPGLHFGIPISSQFTVPVMYALGGR